MPTQVILFFYQKSLALLIYLVNAQQMTLNDELNAIYQTYTELCNTKAYKEQELKTEKIGRSICKNEYDI